MRSNDTRRQSALEKPFPKAFSDNLFEQGEALIRQLPKGERQASLRPIWENHREIVLHEWLACGVDCQRAAALAMHEAYLCQHFGNITGDKRIWELKQALRCVPDETC